MEKLSDEFIRGLVVGEGSFTFSTRSMYDKKGNRVVQKIPTFAIAMSVRDNLLLRNVRDVLGLRNKIYTYKKTSKTSHNKLPMSILIVREFAQIKNIIIPFFYRRLDGHKRWQFDNWLEKIGNDPGVPAGFQTIYLMHKAGFYEDYFRTGNIAPIRDFE